MFSFNTTFLNIALGNHVSVVIVNSFLFSSFFLRGEVLELCVNYTVYKLWWKRVSYCSTMELNYVCVHLCVNLFLNIYIYLSMYIYNLFSFLSVTN